jgi:hypothetical protein
VFDNPDNVALMRSGRSPWIQTPAGPVQIHVDHLIPVAAAPEFSNAWGNLAYQTSGYNFARKDRFVPAMGDKLIEYREAGMLSQQRVDGIFLKNMKIPMRPRQNHRPRLEPIFWPGLFLALAAVFDAAIAA